MRIQLEAKELPDKWYNVVPDLDFRLPPMMSQSGYPVGTHDLEPVAPYSIIEQELDQENTYILIPKKIRDLYAEWRPTPLYRAERLEKSLGTPARIFYKYEGVGAVGYEANTAIAQAYYAANEGIKQVVTATGNGEWGVSLAIVCNYFDIKCKVYMIRPSYEEKVYGRYIMEMLGAEVIPSPGEATRTGREVLSKDPNSPGSLGIALSEAFETAHNNDDMKFCWGTVMNHVLLHQTVIGLEAQKQMRRADAYPDVIIGAVGGGSAFGGLVLPFFQDRKKLPRMVAVETAAAPSLSKGRYTYDYSDYKGVFALLKMYTLGHGFIPPGLRAGGMRYHGISPLISALYGEGQIEARMHTQRQAFDAAVSFARAEGFIASPESSYTIKAVIDEALACKTKGQRKNILFVLNANSNLDIGMVKDFLDGAIEDQPFLKEEVETALKQLPKALASND